MVRALAVLLPAAALLASCTSDPKLVVATDLPRSVVDPLMRTFERANDATVALRLVDDRPAADSFDVYWSRDVAAALDARDSSLLAPLPESLLQNRPTALSDSTRHWVAVSADVRVIAYDPVQIDGERVPTRIFELASPEWASQLALARPPSPAVSWHAATLVAHVGASRTAQFFRELRAAGAAFLENERAVLDSLRQRRRPLALLDGSLAFRARELGLAVGILLPDQDEIGAVVRATAVSLGARAETVGLAHDLIAFLLSPPAARRLSLAAGHVALLPADQPSVGTLTIRDFKACAVTQNAVAAHLEQAVRLLSP